MKIIVEALKFYFRFSLMVNVVRPIFRTKNVTWESSDTKVAIVSKGKVVCTGFGTAVISAVSVNGGFMATCIINATTGIEGITDDAPQKVVKRYDITGREISQPVNGMNIVKTEDGRVLKISVKRK